MLAGVSEPSLWILLPFGLLLAAMALGPSLFARVWEKHYAIIAVGLGAVTVCYYLFVLSAGPRLLDVGHEYVSFIVLIGSLFVISGGIHIGVKGEATPAVNTIFLLLGAIVANVLGTTGASMLLIRPWLRLNKYRITRYHIVFFIFIVSNVGGCLTPIGDPPLFLGYLKGVPFWWITLHCWPMWCIAVAFLLTVFYVLDRSNYRRVPAAVRPELAPAPEPWRVDGLLNVSYLLVVLGAVFLNRPLFLREGIMAGAALLSFFTTSKRVHEANHFNLHPLKEVAILFIGIFATMMPALDWLQSHPARVGQAPPAFFFWASGVLSSVLDNAPTYLSFFSALSGAFHGAHDPTAITSLLSNELFVRRLLALSVGAVFFGASTYIGNGPNFMVKTIADHQKIHTPGFLGFFFRYTLPIMGPMLALIWILFFRQ